MKTKRLWLGTLASLFLLTAFMSSCKDENVEVIGVCPLVISTSPTDMAINVPLDQIITATFNEAMNPQSFTQATFIVESGAAKKKESNKSSETQENSKDVAPVSGTISYSGVVATFTPSNPLVDNTTYLCRILASVNDLMGNALEIDYVWSFSTGATIVPSVISTDPLNLATGVALDKVISANFSVPMDPATITSSTFTVMDGTTSIVGTVSYSGTTATFTPTSELPTEKIFTATITTGAKNVDGIALVEDYVWSFSTGATDFPTVISTDPVDLDIDVEFNKVISANFSTAMDPATINTSTFILMDGTNSIPGTVDYSGTTATFTPTSDLPAGITVTATITTGAENEEGTPLATDFVWSFTTQYSLTVNAENGTVLLDPEQVGYNFEDIVELTATANDGYSFDSWSGDATGNDNPLLVTMDGNKVITANFTENPAIGPGQVDLGTAGDFAILAKTGISTINTTLITGHIGVSPATATAITGFSQTMDASAEFSTSIYVVGNIYAADYAPPTPTYISTAISDQETAFTAAMGLTTDVIVDLGAGDISGMTLVPGLYKWGTGLLITNQGVTLEGGPKDTWVFQIADDFTIQNNASITLAGGALAENIFWITSTQALLGSNVVFHGNILAQTLISLTDGTTVTGRLLSQSAVTLDASTVTMP
jgi:uncharacterized repeat protein (TIGR02543 family)